LEELFALLFSPYLFALRSYVRKLLAIFVKIMYPYMRISRVEGAFSDYSGIYYIWCGKKIAIIERNSRLWVHPWFRRTPIVDVVRYNEYIR